MTNKIRSKLAGFLIGAILCGQVALVAQESQVKRLKYPDFSKGRGSGSKGFESGDKLSPELRILYAQYRNGSRGGDDEQFSVKFSDSQLREFFGIDAADRNPTVNLAVTVGPDADLASLSGAGMNIHMTQANIVYGDAPVLVLGKLADEKSVTRIDATKAAQIPELPLSQTSPILMKDLTAEGGRGNAANTPLANEFDKANLSGKGVVIGIVDTGIDWKHPDFIKPDGTSRIIALWDMYDKSFSESGGKIGTASPKLSPNQKNAFSGTIYTQAQINAALKGEGTVNSGDHSGHGTASAGTAAGNGFASKGKYTGVAPDAELLIVKASDCRTFLESSVLGVEWIRQTAAKLKKPVVINLSFAGHFSAHDGSESVEQYLNAITGKGIPGVIVTVAAGNEARYSMHASGRFGPRKKGQTDFETTPISVTISPEKTGGNGSMLLGLFDPRDEWGVLIEATSTTGLVDKDNKPLVFYVYKTKGELKHLIGEGLNKPDWFDNFAGEVINDSELSAKNKSSKDFLTLKLPPGTYNLFGLGASEKVVNGYFDFYAPSYREVDFGQGTVKSGMVGSPGNAANVITVGAYNFRRNWLNKEGTETVFNLPLGEISEYSNPGGVRKSDRVVKPDIAAPATFTISPLSQTTGSKSAACTEKSMGEGAGSRFVTPDGRYIAWQGTSAAAPFTAGVIALMLQKKPTLDAEQVRQILMKTAKKDSAVGSIPNVFWGYGMLDPVGAIRAVTMAKATK